MWTFALLYLAALNLATFALFALDKRRAIAGGRRIPERTLLGLAALGGSAGALCAQQGLRHKTRKQPFGAQLVGIVGAQTLALAIVLARTVD
ncbi:DUF1294 domain-containing protein [Phenylobacterium sp.]|uniref:DUF1294 domain-containing protein n=1 Tax=Phenylobacterium sp. TaxID=1871053 RepID=UPI002731380B|nr:DUF1294 domain-containing protein [Phenylobacterium sp.]MDP2212315.1 DUF1294 domain-containing protein [Phenylobacterium sp.]